LAEHWDWPNTGIFYSKDVASGKGKPIKKNIIEPRAGYLVLRSWAEANSKTV
jgi:hypothetical protein